ncbi:IpaC/SipC family type III secretion system effector [Citrobacter portucalensis]|uniref:IpaC/SipC family type III secretion system effector n=1 Tax=Citrobacter portucalensis TaxID=1639133 RepID=UPI00288AC30A|nr:IpaC/SipC family type III secretion system effector [Citrobacter portucalensis]WNI88037.1 IpaC/SipC family type III secretion system effector [Citrobacter portucalensis]
MLTIKNSMNQLVCLNTSVAQNNLHIDSGLINVKNILSESKFPDSNKNSSSPEPMLYPPFSDITKKNGGIVTAFLKKNIDDGDIYQDINSIADEFTRKQNGLLQVQMKETQGDTEKFYDISGMSSSAISLLVAANILMLSLNQADTRLSGKLSLVSFDAAKNIASSMMREGISLLSGNISQSVLQLGITGIGAKMDYKGLQTEKNLLQQNGVKFEKLTGESQGIKKVLSKQDRAKSDTDVKENLTAAKVKTKLNTSSDSIQNLKDASLKSRATDVGENATVQGKKTEQQAMESNRLGKIESDIRSQQNSIDISRLEARKKQTMGDIIMRNSMAVGNITGSTGQYAATLERSGQQISQSSNRVASTASDDTRESARKSSNLIQEMLKIMEAINQSKSAAMATIAGNIRA